MTNCCVMLARRAADFPLASALFADAFSISFIALVLRLARTGACKKKTKIPTGKTRIKRTVLHIWRHSVGGGGGLHTPRLREGRPWFYCCACCCLLRTYRYGTAVCHLGATVLLYHAWHLVHAYHTWYCCGCRPVLELYQTYCCIRSIQHAYVRIYHRSTIRASVLEGLG